MTKKKHKVLPPEMLDAVKYEVALELGLMPAEESDGDSAEVCSPDVIADGLPGEEQSE